VAKPKVKGEKGERRLGSPMGGKEGEGSPGRWKFSVQRKTEAIRNAIRHALVFRRGNGCIKRKDLRQNEH